MTTEETTKMYNARFHDLNVRTVEFHAAGGDKGSILMLAYGRHRESPLSRFRELAQYFGMPEQQILVLLELGVDVQTMFEQLLNHMNNGNAVLVSVEELPEGLIL